MTPEQHKKLQFLIDRMNSYGVGERGFEIAAHAFRHLHMQILGRNFVCQTCRTEWEKLGRIGKQKGRSYEAIFNHQKV